MNNASSLGGIRGRAMVDLETFKTQVGTTHQDYDYYYDLANTQWLDLNNNPVNLASIGITITDTFETLANDDRITVSIYNNFEANESGTTSLMSFATNIKGITVS